MRHHGPVQALRRGALSAALIACAAVGIWVAEQLLFRHLGWVV